jgi:hypothetical protein
MFEGPMLRNDNPLKSSAVRGRADAAGLSAFLAATSAAVITMSARVRRTLRLIPFPPGKGGF